VRDPSIDLTLILVSYHSLQPLKAFFESYRRHPIAAQHEIIVVDNAAGDGTAEWIAANHGEVKVIAMEGNQGYARAVNRGIEEGRGRSFLVINPDVELSEGGVDAALQYLTEHPEVGIVGARLLNRDGSRQHSARRFYTLQTILLRRTPWGRLQPDHPQLRRHLMLDDELDHPRPVDWVIGAWMLVRREAVEKVGPMDGRFFLYFEDVDWCYRMWTSGYEVHYFPGASFVHAYERSSGRLNRTLLYHLRSFVSFYDKWGALIYVAKRMRGSWEKLLSFIVDLLLLNGAFALAYLTRRLLDPVLPLPLYSLGDYLPLLAFTNVVGAFTLPLSGRYRERSSSRRLSRWIDAARISLVVTFVVMAGTWLAHTRTFSRLVIVFLIPWLTVALVLSRSLLRRLWGRAQGEGRVDRVLLLGPARQVELLRDELREEDGEAFVVAGAVWTEPPREGTIISTRSLGEVDEIAEILETRHISELLIAGEGEADRPAVAAAQEAAVQGITVYLSHPWASVLKGLPFVRRRHGRHWWLIPPPPAVSGGMWSKVALDRLGGVLLWLLTLPGFVLCSLAGRPVGLVGVRRIRRLGQRRQVVEWTELVDRKGRPLAGFVQAPTAFLALSGRFSLAGPYPLPPRLEKELEPIHLLRFAVKPGLSGLWQQGRFTLDELLRADLEYLETWSLTLDLDLFLSGLPRLLASRELWHRLSSS